MITFSMLAMSLPARAATSDIGGVGAGSAGSEVSAYPPGGGFTTKWGRTKGPPPRLRLPRLARPGRLLVDPLLPGRAVVEQRALRAPRVLLGAQDVRVLAEQFDERRAL